MGSKSTTFGSFELLYQLFHIISFDVVQNMHVYALFLNKCCDLSSSLTMRTSERIRQRFTCFLYVQLKLFNLSLGFFSVVLFGYFFLISCIWFRILKRPVNKNPLKSQLTIQTCKAIRMCVENRRPIALESIHFREIIIAKLIILNYVLMMSSLGLCL